VIAERRLSSPKTHAVIGTMHTPTDSDPECPGAADSAPDETAATDELQMGFTEEELKEMAKSLDRDVLAILGLC
jgi:hypothetical protein